MLGQVTRDKLPAPRTAVDQQHAHYASTLTNPGVEWLTARADNLAITCHAADRTGASGGVGGVQQIADPPACQQIAWRRRVVLDLAAYTSDRAVQKLGLGFVAVAPDAP